MPADESFQYASEPRAVAGKRGGKYREDDGTPGNIMHDKRVVRGNTYAAQVATAEAQEEAERLRLRQEAERSKRLARRGKQAAALRPNTPPAVDGRRHIDIQTENYLEELSDKVPEVNEETQTEAYLDRPPSPMFVPIKAGVDATTQIDDGDLFDFDLEVVPILEVLVGKTLEVAMVEVLEEEELETIRRHQAEFEQQRNAELAEVQRLEAEALRKLQEKKRRVEEKTKKREATRQLAAKVAARSFAKSYLSDLHSSVFQNLVDSGHFYDPLGKEIQDRFMPWVLDQMVASIDQVVQAQELASSLVQSALDAGQRRQQEEASSRSAGAAGAGGAAGGAAGDARAASPAGSVSGEGGEEVAED